MLNKFILLSNFESFKTLLHVGSTPEKGYLQISDAPDITEDNFSGNKPTWSKVLKDSKFDSRMTLFSICMSL